MKFNSVKEYFYKLNNMGYQLMMVPLILFTLYYSRLIESLSGVVVLSREIASILFFVLCGLNVIVLTLVQVMTARKARMIAREIGLGIKLEKLGTVLSRKMVAISIMVMLMPLALLITGDDYFSIAFVLRHCGFFYSGPHQAGFAGYCNFVVMRRRW